MREIFHLGPNEGDLPAKQCVLGAVGFHLSTAPWGRQIKVSSRASTFQMAVRGSQVLRPSREKLNL